MGISAPKQETYHLLVYVENAASKLKKFKTLSSMKGFITKFKKKHRDPLMCGDNWIDYTVTNIYGSVDIYPESCLGPVSE